MVAVVVLLLPVRGKARTTDLNNSQPLPVECQVELPKQVLVPVAPAQPYLVQVEGVLVALVLKVPTQAVVRLEVQLPQAVVLLPLDHGDQE